MLPGRPLSADQSPYWDTPTGLPPEAAVAEYERGAALGSGLALERRAELERESGGPDLAPCARPDEAAHL